MEKVKISVKSVKLVNDYELPTNEELKTIKSSKNIFEVGKLLGHNTKCQEHLYLYCLNNANNINCIALLGIGTLDSVNVDIKSIFQYVILSNSNKIVLVHNHPSGKLYPSKYDIDFAKKVNEACKIMNVELLDNIIITENDYISYQKEVM